MTNLRSIFGHFLNWILINFSDIDMQRSQVLDQFNKDIFYQSDFWSLDCVETLLMPCSSAGSSFKPKSIMLLPSSNGDHHHTFCLLKLKSFFCQKSSFNLNAWDTQVVVVQVCFKDNHIEASHNEVIKRCWAAAFSSLFRAIFPTDHLFFSKLNFKPLGGWSLVAL